MANPEDLPLAVTMGDPATAWWAYMSQAIIYGLVFSTALTLVVTPCMLMVRETATQWKDEKVEKFQRLLGGIRKPEEVIYPVPAE